MTSRLSNGVPGETHGELRRDLWWEPGRTTGADVKRHAAIPASLLRRLAITQERREGLGS